MSRGITPRTGYHYVVHGSIRKFYLTMRAFMAKDTSRGVELLAVHRGKYSLGSALRWEDPEYRARATASMRAAGLRRRKFNAT